jgi:hypothetical protein
MDDTMIERAQEVLRDLEARGKAQMPGKVSGNIHKLQLTFFEADLRPVVEALTLLPYA